MCTVKDREVIPIADFKWLQAERIKYGGNTELVWESVSRTTRKGAIDGVAVLALVYTENFPPEVLLVSQFRPPLGQRCIEFPAGLSDDGETPLNTALRELKEETGYTGVTHGTSPVISGEPGLTNNVLRVVRVHIDGNAPANQNLKPQLDHEESAMGLHVHRLPLTGLERALEGLATKKNYAIDSRLYAFALGLAFPTGQDPLVQPLPASDPMRKSLDDGTDGETRPSISLTSKKSRSDSGADGSTSKTKGLGKGLPARKRDKGDKFSTAGPSLAPVAASVPEACEVDTEPAGAQANASEPAKPEPLGDENSASQNLPPAVQSYWDAMSACLRGLDWRHAVLAGGMGCVAFCAGAALGSARGGAK